jgi:hypothetical protein
MTSKFIPCPACEKFFASHRCSAVTHGECDCPKCQGFCTCKFWVGLTHQEIHKAVVDTGIHVFEGDIYKFVEALENVLREKNT